MTGGQHLLEVRNMQGPRRATEKALNQTSLNERAYRAGQATYDRIHGIRERNYAVISTTPILGQYIPSYAWPDDWGWYWEYLDAYLFVPEVEFAVNLKNRQIWKPGYHFNASSDSKEEEMKQEFEDMKLFDTLQEASQTALIEGNAYLPSQDNSDAKWAEGTVGGDYAVGTRFDNFTGAPRPLVKFEPATRFYGLANTDPRMMRMQVHPQQWDDKRHTVLVEKYIQRRWSGPMWPNYAIGSTTELDFHPEQMLHLAFHKIFGGLYGYSTLREVLFTLKGYLLMQQFLPQIVEHRADPLLWIRVGGDMTGPAGIKTTWLPKEDDFNLLKTRVASRMPGEDIFTDALSEVKEVYTGRGSAERVNEYITQYKERVLLGLGIPMAAATFSGGGEIKFGTLQFELMDDETRENQGKMRSFINDWIIPKLQLNLGHKEGDGPELEIAMIPPGETAKR